MRRNIYIGKQEDDNRNDDVKRSCTSLKSIASAKYHKFIPQSYKQQNISSPFGDMFGDFTESSDKYFTIGVIQDEKSDQKQKKVFGSIMPVSKTKENKSKNKYRKQSICFVKQDIKSDENLINSARSLKQTKLSFIYKDKNEIENTLLPKRQNQRVLGDTLKQVITNGFNFRVNQIEKESSLKSKPTGTNMSPLNPMLREIFKEFQLQINKVKCQFAEWITSLKSEIFQIQSLGLIKNIDQKNANVDKIFKNICKTITNLTSKTSSFIEQLNLEEGNSYKKQMRPNKQLSQEIDKIRKQHQSNIVQPDIRLTASFAPSNNNQLNKSSIGKVFKSQIKKNNEDAHFLKKIGVLQYSKIRHKQDNTKNEYGLLDKNPDLVLQKDLSSQASNSSLYQIFSMGPNNSSSTMDLNLSNKQRTNPYVRWNRPDKRNRSYLANSSIDQKMKGFEQAMKKIKNIIATN